MQYENCWRKFRFISTLSFCGQTVQHVKDLIQHLKGHIIDSEQVQCPF